jgi:hypothetical protein
VPQCRHAQVRIHAAAEWDTLSHKACRMEACAMYRLRLERMAPDSPELTAGIHMQPIGPGTRQIRVPYLPALRGTPFWLWRQTERPMSRRGVPRCRFALCIVHRINTAVQLPGPLQRRALLLYAAFCWQTNKHASTHARRVTHAAPCAHARECLFSRRCPQQKIPATADPGSSTAE